ncbi:MAG: PAS domain-containing sensor histidine kinase [Actinomycetota bacterium]|nr:PAS domain-containing sensor histidine kinase [Actinomycetota bacterium]MDH5223385.1 PAS domain-containing sensor histidine kinase [Actinomycetota bacterium]MDH5312543.1 PAS domain-containing sensor histidine kinase [Actinomycetota bacterium]
MSDTSARERARAHLGTGVVLGTAALAIVVTYLWFPAGSREQGLASEVMVAGACLLSGGIILRAVGKGDAWRGTVPLAYAMFMIGAVNVLFLVSDVNGRGVYRPRLSDLAFVLLLVPIVEFARGEFRHHLDERDTIEIATDVFLIAASVTALMYVVVRPFDASPQASMTAAIFSVLTATQLATIGALLLWKPSRRHLVLFGIFASMAAATATFGWHWTRGSFDGTIASIDFPFMLGPLALAAWVVFTGPASADSAILSPPRRWVRPVLTSVSVVTACAALAVVAIFDDERGVAGAQSTAIILLLGAGIAARILSNQTASTLAHRETRDALEEKERALGETDQALERVREANETLRQSEEHLRLVFETAEDGIVELDEHGIVLRANEAFAEMVSLPEESIEDQPWTAVASVVVGADEAFAGLRTGGQSQISRPDGQILHLESRRSEVPTTPPRTLLLVRDVTAARVADQTIRSLFQFLQDRDEDRSRLMRRTNAAIEAERNRIARDLHDGPVQGVSAASLSLEAALLMIRAGDVDEGIEVLTKIREELAGEADALRRLMSGLRPPVLEERGLLPALRETLVRFGSDQGVDTEFAGRVDVPLPEDLETLAYRVVQEALSNAAKHSKASQVMVMVQANESQLRVEIEDDGQGFDAGLARDFLRDGRVGLASMRERVELASGSLVVRSSPGRGTSIVASLPLDELAASQGGASMHEAS